MYGDVYKMFDGMIRVDARTTVSARAYAMWCSMWHAHVRHVPLRARHHLSRHSGRWGWWWWDKVNLGILDNSESNMRTLVICCSSSSSCSLRKKNPTRACEGGNWRSLQHGSIVYMHAYMYIRVSWHHDEGVGQNSHELFYWFRPYARGFEKLLSTNDNGDKIELK